MQDVPGAYVPKPVQGPEVSRLAARVLGPPGRPTGEVSIRGAIRILSLKVVGGLGAEPPSAFSRDG
jgi:hypothetical protein